MIFLTYPGLGSTDLDQGIPDFSLNQSGVGPEILYFLSSKVPLLSEDCMSNSKGSGDANERMGEGAFL